MKRAVVMSCWIFAAAACDRGAAYEASPASGVATAAPASASAAMPSEPAPSASTHESIYQLPLRLIDQNGNAIGLDVDAGHPVLIGMFYAKCKSACPLLVSNIRALEGQLTDAQRAAVRVLLVSFDGEHDTPEVLTAVAAQHHLDAARWRLASATADDARTLAALLGIQYRRMENGEFAHNSILTLLAPDGTIVASTEALEPPAGELLERVRASASAPSHP